MRTYLQKTPESRILEKNVKSSGADIAQLVRVRLNDDLSENQNFEILRNVQTSSLETDPRRGLPWEERKKLTPHVEKAKPSEEPVFTLGNQEDIVFEGHGKNRFFFFGERTMEGKGAEELSQIVFSIVTTYGDCEQWNGRVVLLGCYTEPIVKPLQQLLLKLLERSIAIVGTRADIVSGNKRDGSVGVHYKDDKPKAGMLDFTSPEDVFISSGYESSQASDDGWTMVNRMLGPTPAPDLEDKSKPVPSLDELPDCSYPDEKELMKLDDVQ